MVISATFFNAVSEIAIVPDSECRMPTLMVSAAWANSGSVATAAPTATALSLAAKERRVLCCTTAMGMAPPPGPDSVISRPSFQPACAFNVKMARVSDRNARLITLSSKSLTLISFQVSTISSNISDPGVSRCLLP